MKATKCHSRPLNRAITGQNYCLGRLSHPEHQRSILQVAEYSQKEEMASKQENKKERVDQKVI